MGPPWIEDNGDEESAGRKIWVAREGNMGMKIQLKDVKNTLKAMRCTAVTFTGSSKRMWSPAEVDPSIDYYSFLSL